MRFFYFTINRVNSMISFYCTPFYTHLSPLLIISNFYYYIIEMLEFRFVLIKQAESINSTPAFSAGKQSRVDSLFIINPGFTRSYYYSSLTGLLFQICLFTNLIFQTYFGIRCKRNTQILVIDFSINPKRG